MAAASIAHENLRATLRNFYATHNPEKCSSVDTILERFAGNTSQLILELEKKYNDKIAKYAPKTNVSESSTGQAIANETVNTKLQTTEGRQQEPPSPSSSSSVLPHHQQQYQQQQQYNELVAARNEVSRLRLELEKKDALCSSRILENNKEQARKYSLSKTQWAETELSLKERLEELQLELINTTRSLKETKKEVDNTQKESNQRLDQLCSSLEREHRLKASLSSLLETIGVKHNPYQNNEGSNPSLSVTNSGDSIKTVVDFEDEVTKNMEVHVLLKAKEETEQKCQALETKLEQITQKNAELNSEIEVRNRIIEENKTSNEEYKLAAKINTEKMHMLEQRLEKERQLQLSMESEVKRLQGVVLLAAQTRRQLQEMASRDQNLLAEATRQRVYQSVEQSLMAREECQSQEFHIVEAMRCCYEEEKQALRLDMEEMSRTVLLLNNENKKLQLEVSHSKKELKRAADLVVKFAPKGFVQTFVTEGTA